MPPELVERIGSLLHHIGQQRVAFRLLEEKTPFAWPEVHLAECDLLSLTAAISAWQKGPSKESSSDLERTVALLERGVVSDADTIRQFADEYGVDLSALTLDG